MAATAAWTQVPTRRSGRVQRRRPTQRNSRVAERTASFFEQAFKFAEELFPDLWAHLTQSGRERFVHELVKASFVPEIRRRTELERTIEAWHLTMVARHSPDYLQGIEDARHGRVRSLDELRAELGP